MVFRVSGDVGINLKTFSLKGLEVLGKKSEKAMPVGCHAKITARVWKKQLTKQIDWLSFSIGIFVDGIPSNFNFENNVATFYNEQNSNIIWFG